MELVRGVGWSHGPHNTWYLLSRVAVPGGNVPRLTPRCRRGAVVNPAPHAPFLCPGADDEDGGRGGPAGRPQLAKELAFFERAKQRLRNKDAYNDFLKCLTMYTQEIISRQELLVLANDIIGRLPDLMVRSAVQCREGDISRSSRNSSSATERNGVGRGAPYRSRYAPLHGGRAADEIRGGGIATAGAGAGQLAGLSMRSLYRGMACFPQSEGCMATPQGQAAGSWQFVPTGGVAAAGRRFSRLAAARALRCRAPTACS